MSDTVHNWDIEVLEQMRSEMQKLCDVLKENREYITSEGFELLSGWQGRAGRKMLLVTASDADRLENIIERYSQLIEQLDSIITKCYTPCEADIIKITSQLL